MFAAIASAHLLAACASTEQAPADETAQAEADEAAAAPQAALLGPFPGEAAKDEVAGERETGEVETGPGEESGPAFWRADGRPVWWQGEPQTLDGRTRVTVEAIGDDLASARRAAVEAGRAALVRAVGRAPRDERTEAVQMRRLAGEGPGRSRYVVYALLSAKSD